MCRVSRETEYWVHSKSKSGSLAWSLESAEPLCMRLQSHLSWAVPSHQLGGSGAKAPGALPSTHWIAPKSDSFSFFLLNPGLAVFSIVLKGIPALKHLTCSSAEIHRCLMCILNILLLSHPEQGHLLKWGKDIKIYKILKLAENVLNIPLCYCREAYPYKRQK